MKYEIKEFSVPITDPKTGDWKFNARAVFVVKKPGVVIVGKDYFKGI